MNYFISVIIPTHCRSIGTLDKAVQSVKRQSISVFEIIIVDDNVNTTLSENIISYCRQNDLVYIVSGGIGAGGARNIGINTAKGDYIAFLDDDDIWLPNKLCLQMSLFSEPNTALVYSRGYTIKTDRSGVTTKTPYATDSYYRTSVNYTDLLEKNYIGTTTQLIINKDILMQIGGFDASLPSRQDYDLCLRISKKYRCVGVDDYLFIHYIHGKNQITADSLINMKGYQMLFKKYKTDICQIKGAPVKWYYRISRYALASSSYMTFIKYLLLAIAANPIKMKEIIKNCIQKV